VPKATAVNAVNLCSYLLVVKRLPLHLAKDTSGEIENCKAADSLLKKAHLLRYASALAAHVRLKYAPLLAPCDALYLILNNLKSRSFSTAC
jgi:hypothetical protein